MTKETNKEVEKNTPSLRRIVIETDGSKIIIKENETAGMLELKAVLTEILTQLR